MCLGRLSLRKFTGTTLPCQVVVRHSSCQIQGNATVSLRSYGFQQGCFISCSTRLVRIRRCLFANNAVILFVFALSALCILYRLFLAVFWGKLELVSAMPR